MDDIDRAQDCEQMNRDLAIAAVLARVRNDAVIHAGPRSCKTCGTTIAARRIAAYPGATRCLYCQTKAENGRV